MTTSTAAGLRVGAWNIDEQLGQMTRGEDCVRLDPRTLRLLLCLIERAGQVVSAEALLEQVWPGVVVSPDSVYQAVASLRRQLGDDPKQASYIATVPRKGYRLVAEVSRSIGSGPGTVVVGGASSLQHVPKGWRRRQFAIVAGTSTAILFGAGLWLQNAPASIPSDSNGITQKALYQKSIAVLPFLDLTDQMSNEVFADGITEELISRFSKIPGFKVPPLSAAFPYQGKHLPVNELARHLGVKYVLGGSIRKSGNTMRIAARLLRADDGFIVWTETYDRPANDLLKIQDDIADKVSNALRATIE